MTASPGSPAHRRATLGAFVAAGFGVGTRPAGARPAGARGVGHVALLGDSIFDNKAYVAGGPDVVAQLRRALPGGWRATLAAADGASTDAVARQLPRVPADVTHLVVSAGGNDALRQEGVLGAPARSVGEALLRLATVRERFHEDYRAMLEAVLARGLPVAVCTVYDPRFPEATRQRLAVAGLALFNDVIGREAFARGLALLDLRLVCAEDGDFANPIEPSVQGGAKIAAAIAAWAAKRSPAGRRSEVIASGEGG